MGKISDLIRNPWVIGAVVAAAIAIPVAVGSGNGDEPISPDFVAETREGFAPLEVLFTDYSTGSVDWWAWDFDSDGIVDSTEQNPSFTYENPGTYTISLTVPGEVVDVTETKTNYIRVLAPASVSGPAANATRPYGPPVDSTGNITHGFTTDDSRQNAPQAEFRASPRYGNAPLEVLFTDNSTGDVDSREWDFNGDATVDSWGQNPSYTYNNPGIYTVSLTVGGIAWSTETKTDYIAVLSPPHADFYSSKPYGNIPHEVHFTDNSTGDSNYWNWDLDGDGSVDSWEQNPSYTYTEAGRYTVSLTVGEITSSTETKVEYITVLNPRGNGDGGDGGDDGDGGGVEPGDGEEPS